MNIKTVKDKVIVLNKVQQQVLKGGANQTATTTEVIIIEDINTM